MFLHERHWTLKDKETKRHPEAQCSSVAFSVEFSSVLARRDHWSRFCAVTGKASPGLWGTLMF